VRARESISEDIKRKKNQISKYLLVSGAKAPAQAWSRDYRDWLLTVKFKFEAQRMLLNEYMNALNEAEQRLVRIEKEIRDFSQSSAFSALIESLQAMRGVSLITAATVVAEVGDLTRFLSPRQLMAYAGLVPSEHSSGQSVYRGKITKAGNSHLRRIIVEAAWHYRHPPRVSSTLKKRQEGVSSEVCEIAWKAQHRLNLKYRRMSSRGRSNNIAAVAVAREMLGFMWAISRQVQIESQPKSVSA
jgi:transposase